MGPLPEPSDGCFDGRLHRYALRVYYEDTDAGGVVYHANYLRWFERARSDMLRLLGIGQRDALDAGEGTFAVAELGIRYLRPARLDDTVLIETRVHEMGVASGRIFQRALRGNVLLSEAQVRVGFIGSDGRPKRQPAAWRQAFASIISDPEG